VTIKLNSEMSRFNLKSNLKKNKIYVSRYDEHIIEHPTYYLVDGMDFVFPKLFYGLEGGIVYVLHDLRESGEHALMEHWKLV